MTAPDKIKLFRFAFVADDDGAVTVDWIVLTASLVFMGIAAVFYVGSSVPELADSVSEYMQNVDVGTESGG